MDGVKGLGLGLRVGVGVGVWGVAQGRLGGKSMVELSAMIECLMRVYVYLYVHVLHRPKNIVCSNGAKARHVLYVHVHFPPLGIRGET